MPEARVRVYFYFHADVVAATAPVLAVDGLDGWDSCGRSTGLSARGKCEMATRTRWTKAAAVVAMLGWILAVSTAAAAANVAYWRFDNDGQPDGSVSLGNGVRG